MVDYRFGSVRGQQFGSIALVQFIAAPSQVGSALVDVGLVANGKTVGPNLAVELHT